MSENYTIHVLSNEEYDLLPYKKARESLGCADAKRGVAYIRHTGVKDLDDNTIRHEFDELLQTVSPHEEDGIRYKSGGSLGSIIGPIVGTIVTVVTGNPAAGIAVASAISGGTQAHTQTTKPEKYGEPSFGSIGGAALKGGIGAYAGGQALSGAIAGGTQAAPGFFSKAAGIAKGAVVGTPASSGGANVTSQGINVGSTYTAPTSGALGSGGSLLSNSGNAASQQASRSWAQSPGLTTAQGRTLDLAAATPIKASSAPAASGSSIGGIVKNVATGLAKNTITNALTPQASTAVSGQQGGYDSIIGSQASSGDPFAKWAPNQLSAPNTPNTPYIGQGDIDNAFLGIDRNIGNRTREAQQTFRGQAPSENSSYNSILGQIGGSRGLEQQQFLDYANQTNDQRYKDAVKKDIMTYNNLTEAQFNEYLAQARRPDASDNYKQVFSVFLA